jgi:hypothetical protein
MQYAEVLGRVSRALEQGDITPADLERLLRVRSRDERRRPDAASVLAALGGGVAFAGVALLYAVQFQDMSRGAKLVTPFLFPAAATGLAAVLAVAHRPRWQVNAAGMVGQIALAAAFLVAGAVIAPADAARFGAVCAAAATVEVLACHRLIGSVWLTGWGLSASIVAFCSFSATSAGVDRLGPLLLAESLVAAAVAALLLAGRRELGVAAARTASLLAYGAALAGQDADLWGQASMWHLVISVAVVATFLTAAVLAIDSLVWVGALGGLVWLGMVAAVVGSSSGVGVVVVVSGIGLVILGGLVAQVRRISHPHP